MKFVAGLACLTLSCVGFGQLPPGFTDVPIVSNIQLPTSVAFLPDGRLLIGQKAGTVRLYKNGALTANPFASIGCDTSLGRGFLGIKVDPQFNSNHFVYFFYTAGALSLNPPATPKNRVSRFQVSGDEVIPGSETILIDNMESETGSDNGGGMGFGTDGKLYISTGQGSLNTLIAQDLTSLAGKVLRINPDGSIPPDNPFVNQLPKRPEIWAYGFRNPFRLTVRPGTSTPFVADVGEVTWEELNIITPGANYGWPLAEGTSSNSAFVNPAFSYDHVSGSKCICGGIFMKSTKFPSAYQNRYIYGEYKQHLLNYVDFSASNAVTGQGTFAASATGPVDFAMSPDGSLVYVALISKTVQKVSYQPIVSSINIGSNIDGGTTFEASLTLNAVAPISGQRVSLSSSSPALVVPAQLVLLSGKTNAPFSVTTLPVAINTEVTLSASVPGTTLTKIVSLRPNALKGVYSTVNAVPSGVSFNLTVGLLNPASQPAAVGLSADSGALSLPAQTTVATLATSKTFQAMGQPVTVPTTITVSASWAGSTKIRTVTILPAELASLTASPNPIRGGTNGTATVRLTGTTTGALVNLSDNSSLISTPSSVSIAAGNSGADFSFGTLPVNSTVTRTMTATLGPITRTVQITLVK
jgi:glucose/arabinose dehydrogenase